MASHYGRSLREMIKGRCREYLREPSAFFFVLLMPLMWMTILGYSLDHPHQEVHGIGLVAGPATAPAARMALLAAPQLKVTEAEQNSLVVLLKRGDIAVVATPPPTSSGTWSLAYDPQSRDSGHARAAVVEVLERAAGRRDLVITEDHALKVPGTRYVDFLVPGLIALSIMTTSLFGTGHVIVSNRREGLLKRYLATPMRPSAYILSHLVGRAIMLAAEIGVILVGARVIFGFQVAGSIGSLIIVAVCGATAFTAMALLFASRTANMALMNGLTNLVTMPMMLLGGIWFSRANFPEWLAQAARALPLTALADALRRVALEGVSLATVAPELGLLAAVAVIFSVASAYLFRWY